MTRVWVLGASGMLGHELVRVLGARGVAFVGTSSADVDVTDGGAVDRFCRGAGFTHILNASAYTAVDKAEAEEEAARALNAEGPRHLAKAAERAGARLLHVSTDYVFDGQGERPYREDDPCAPLGAYGRTKRAGEEAVLALYGEGSAVVRTSWLFGAHGKSFVHTMLRLMKEREQLRVVADQRGRPTAASDLAEALVALAGVGDGAPSSAAATTGVLHFANQGETTWHGFATAILEEARAQGATLACRTIDAITTADYPTPAARPAYSVLDTSRIEAALGRPCPSWRPPLRDVVRAILRA